MISIEVRGAINVGTGQSGALACGEMRRSMRPVPVPGVPVEKVVDALMSEREVAVDADERGVGVVDTARLSSIRKNNRVQRFNNNKRHRCLQAGAELYGVEDCFVSGRVGMWMPIRKYRLIAQPQSTRPDGVVMKAESVIVPRQIAIAAGGDETQQDKPSLH